MRLWATAGRRCNHMLHNVFGRIFSLYWSTSLLIIVIINREHEMPAWPQNIFSYSPFECSWATTWSGFNINIMTYLLIIFYINNLNFGSKYIKIDENKLQYFFLTVVPWKYKMKTLKWSTSTLKLHSNSLVCVPFRSSTKTLMKEFTEI